MCACCTSLRQRQQMQPHMHSGRRVTPPGALWRLSKAVLLYTVDTDNYIATQFFELLKLSWAHAHICLGVVTSLAQVLAAQN